MTLETQADAVRRIRDGLKEAGWVLGPFPGELVSPDGEWTARTFLRNGRFRVVVAPGAGRRTILVENDTTVADLGIPGLVEEDE